ncbi:hypothetical protein BDW74DRAFT_174008 [Aspergillus multicolor]|uniref:uncharacterized protein n=1 Tax=Aspergillus multicolor TaxID=41759 RepID=UPI003CCCA697
MTPLLLVVSLGLASRSLASIAGNNISSAIDIDDFSQCLSYKDHVAASNTLALAAGDLNSGSAPFTWTMGIRHDTELGPDSDDYSGTGTEDDIIFLDISGTTALYLNLFSTAIEQTQELPDDCARIVKRQIDDAARRVFMDGQDAARFCERWTFDYTIDDFLRLCLDADLGNNEKKVNSIDPISPEDCTSASGLEYNIRPMYTKELRYRYDEIESKSLIQGTMPIVTVLFPPANSNVTEPETHFLNLAPHERLLRLVDYSRAHWTHSSCLYVVWLDWLVGVVFPVLEYSRY